jgi:NTP pyrophosphatase (non-canonical NTP hydrolase)
MIDLKQKEFQVWQEHNFGKGELSDMIHGMAEEVGEMSHAYLKSKNKIRGMTPELAKEKMADAFADTVVFGLQAMTALGLNAEEVLNKTFKEVLARDWKNNPEGNGYSQHNK